MIILTLRKSVKIGSLLKFNEIFVLVPLSVKITVSNLLVSWEFSIDSVVLSDIPESRRVPLLLLFRLEYRPLSDRLPK